jgi:phosphotransferase system  glucose/maltose/N-acetylglucosamine-specific IIC component
MCAGSSAGGYQMKYKLTDGRPWYKQVISGIVLSALICFSTLVITILLMIGSMVVRDIYLEAGISGILFWAVITPSGILAVKIFFSVIDWAFGDDS